jgi:hypothetical protein
MPGLALRQARLRFCSGPEQQAAKSQPNSSAPFRTWQFWRVNPPTHVGGCGFFRRLTPAATGWTPVSMFFW